MNPILEHDVILATVSIRRLFALRHCPRDGACAKLALKQWLRSLKRLNAIIEGL